jgi:hypothetical protein
MHGEPALTVAAPTQVHASCFDAANNLSMVSG